MDKPVRMEATYAEHTDHEDGSFSGGMVTRNGVFLPISEDGSVGGLEEWMVRHVRLMQKSLGEYRDLDLGYQGEDGAEDIATAISAIIQAAKGGAG